MINSVDNKICLPAISYKNNPMLYVARMPFTWYGHEYPIRASICARVVYFRYCFGESLKNASEFISLARKSITERSPTQFIKNISKFVFQVLLIVPLVQPFFGLLISPSRILSIQSCFGLIEEDLVSNAKKEYDDLNAEPIRLEQRPIEDVTGSEESSDISEGEDDDEDVNNLVADSHVVIDLGEESEEVDFGPDPDMVANDNKLNKYGIFALAVAVCAIYQTYIYVVEK